MGLLQFSTIFDKEDKCVEYYMHMRWPDEILCPHCGTPNPYITNRGYKCRSKFCAKKFTNISGTIMENTKVPLRAWFFMVYTMALAKKPLSSIQWGKNMGVTQTTAWTMTHKIRSVLHEKEIKKLSGIVEVDETFLSKGNKWTRWGGISTRKEPIIGLVERGGRVIIIEIEDRLRSTLHNEIKKYVEPGSIVYTDGNPAYNKLMPDYIHDYVEHSLKEYVRGDVHTNTIENVWSFLKKSVRNAHHSVSAKHTQIYCDELAYRYNYRDWTPMQRFDDIMNRLIAHPPMTIKFEDN